jgi:hypothetical protein
MRGIAVLNIDRYKLFHFFKYTIYALLTLNVFLFFAEEWAAAATRFADGVEVGDIIEGFAATIDTAAWVWIYSGCVFVLRNKIRVHSQNASHFILVSHRKGVVGKNFHKIGVKLG